MREGAGVSELGTQKDSGVKRENAIMDAEKGNSNRRKGLERSGVRCLGWCKGIKEGRRERGVRWRRTVK